jgi:hypothetical protein
MPADETESDDDEWRFSVDEFDDPEETEETPVWEDDTAAMDQSSDEYRDVESDDPPSPFRLDEPLEPGDIDLENAFFVLVGIVLVLVPILVLFGSV